MPAEQYFSAHYAEARVKFLRAANSHGARLASHRNPYAKGPSGEDLFIDVATLGPDDAETALFLVSATHGVEGFAGSAVEIGLFDSRLIAKRPARAKLVILHALNPYGFAWLRRVNEDNVDLNRNCVRFDRPRPTNAGYEALAPAIAPQEWSETGLSALNARLRDFAHEHGFFALQEAITAGQYDYPDGLYFGGHKEAWSIGVLKHVVQRELIRARRLVFLDIHTGLGGFGDLEIISEFPLDSAAYRDAKSWWGDQVKTTASGESLSAHLSGTLDGMLPSLLPEANVTGAALEFGTYPGEAVFRALRADNWLHAFAAPGAPETKAIKEEIRRAFFPDTAEWKNRVWEQAASVLEKTLPIL
ncbi:MAG: DUF2817 domain-containing protein [Alphaproteobacteria bacterium]|nr:DUF2817 domain-containing protein [Alphaproteobacteria bacterium]